MGSINPVVRPEDRGRIALVVMDNQPVNALGRLLREGIIRRCTRLATTPNARPWCCRHCARLLGRGG